jgi:hypothetical protein
MSLAMPKNPEYEYSQMRWIEDIRRALAGLDAIEMDEGIRKTITRCLNAEFAEARDRFEDLSLRENDGKKWTENDDQIIREFLKEKAVPTSVHWNMDDYTARRFLSVELGFKLLRSEKSVAKRARALGFAHFNTNGY